MYRAYILLGGALCAVAAAMPFIDEPIQTLPPVIALAQFGAGFLILFVAILDGATDTRRNVLSTLAINAAALIFLAYTVGAVFLAYGVVDIPKDFPIRRILNYVMTAGFAVLAASSFGVKKSEDANFANLWITISCASFAGALLLGGAKGYILSFSGTILIIIASILITTEKRRDEWGAVAPNIAAVLFVASAAIPMALMNPGKELKFTEFGAPLDIYGLSAAGAFLGGWVMLFLSALALRQRETGGNRFSAWLLRVSIACVIAAAIIFYLANTDTEFRTGLLPLAAVTVFSACMPLLILGAVFAVTEGARWGPGAALLELSAIAFVAAGLVSLIVVSLPTNPPASTHAYHDPQLIAKVAAGISLAGWIFLALSALGLRNRTE